MNPEGTPESYWRTDPGVMLKRLGSAPEGLTAAEAAQRLRDYGPNLVRERRRLTRTRVFANQNPQPTAPGAGLRGGSVGADRRVGRCAHRLRHCPGDGRDRIRARVPRGIGSGGPAGAHPLANPRAARRPAHFACQPRTWCPATWCCCRPAAWCPRTASFSRRPTSSSARRFSTGESFPVEKRLGTGCRKRGSARPAELRLPRHQRAKRHRALPDRGDRPEDAVRRHRAFA